MCTKELELSIEKKYNIPNNIVKKYINDKILVISVDTANWIVLDNEKQENIFEKLKHKYVYEVLEDIEKENISEDDFIFVLTQLEARKFESIEVNIPQQNGICIYLTDECNLRCKHCYMYSGYKNDNEMTTNEIIYILDNFKKHGGEVVTFTGGEVTLRNDLETILEFSKKFGLKNTVLSNGVSWNDNLIERTYKYIDEIQISMDGYDEESNSKVRGKGTFEKVVQNIDKLFNKGLRLSVAVTPLLDDLDQNKKSYIKFGKQLIDKYSSGEFHLKYNYELLEGRDIKVDKESNKIYSKIMHEIVESCYPDSENIEFVINHKDNTIFNNCGYGGLTIGANGDVYFCNRIHELTSCGNIRDKSFNEFIKLSKRAKEISDINNLYPCSSCDLKYICGGGCRIPNFPDLINIESLDNKNLDICRIIPCTQYNKDRYYKLMIETNEEFFC